MLIRPAIGDTDPIRYRRPTPDGQFSGNIIDEAMRVFGEATEDCQRGQTGFGREPALDVGEVRIEHRWHSYALFVWLAHPPMDDAQLPQMYIIPSPFANAAAFVAGAGGLAAAASLPARAPTRVPSSVWASLISASRATGSSVR